VDRMQSEEVGSGSVSYEINRAIVWTNLMEPDPSNFDKLRYVDKFHASILSLI